MSPSKKSKNVDVYKLTSKVKKDYANEQKYRQEQAQIRATEGKRRYSQTRAGKISGFLSSGIRLSQGNIIQNIAQRQYGSRPISFKGRPKKSYDKRYAAYGGVYGYRKVLAAKLRAQRAMDMRNASLTPQEQQLLSNLQMQRRIATLNPENRAIPDTSGQVNLGGLHKEMDDAANIIP